MLHLFNLNIFKTYGFHAILLYLSFQDEQFSSHIPVLRETILLDRGLYYLRQETWAKKCLTSVFGCTYNSVQNFSLKRTDTCIWRQPIYVARYICFTSNIPTKAFTLLHWENLFSPKKYYLLDLEQHHETIIGKDFNVNPA